MIRARTCFQVLIAVTALGAACGKSSTSPSDSGSVTSFISGVSTVGGSPIQGSSQTGAAPGANGGPTATPTVNGNAVNNGSNFVSMHGSAPFTAVIVSVANGTGTGPGDSIGFPQATSGTTIDGFFRVNLPAAVTDQQFLVSFGKAIPNASFDLNFQLVAVNGTIGAASTQRMTVLSAGTGQVQITASWDQPSDVDLHVVEPNNNEVFWGAPTSSTGGQLDLDSNSACFIDNPIRNAENTRWTTGAPIGTYTVRLDLFASCSVALTNFVVTVNNGSTKTTFTGQFTAAQADGGNLGSGRLITTFNHTASSLIPELFTPPGPSRAPSPEKLRIAAQAAAARGR